jgi:hypothetical protein
LKDGTQRLMISRKLAARRMGISVDRNACMKPTNTSYLCILSDVA